MSLTTSYSSSSASACASCKYQRKKCTKSCLLAPYFPQELQKQFLNAHRLFGVSNMTKMLKEVEESKRDVAMRNLIFHANARAVDPVGGLLKIVSDLNREIDICQVELCLLQQQLNMYRPLAQQQQQIQRQTYKDLLEEIDEYIHVADYENQNIQQQQHQEKEVVMSDLEHNNLLNQIFMYMSSQNA